MNTKFATILFAALCWLPIAGCSTDTMTPSVDSGEAVDATAPADTETTADAAAPSQGSGSSN